MSKNRKCDKRCHDAKRAKCSCWCGGLFHGAAGAAARDAFVSSFGEDIPIDGEPSEDLYGTRDRFVRALAAAGKTIS